MRNTAGQSPGVNISELTAKGAHVSFEEKLTLCQSLNLHFLTDECHLLS